MNTIRRIISEAKKFIIICYNEAREPYFVGMPAQLAFYLFLSVMPSMVLASQLFGIFDLTLEDIEAWMNIDMTTEAAQAFSSMLDTKPTGANSVMLIIVAIWGASRILFSLAKITNRINSSNGTAGRPFIKDRIIAILSMLIMLLTLVAAIVFLVYAPAVIDLALNGNVVGTILSRIWKSLRWFVVTGLFFATITYVYCTSPKIRPKPKEVAPGAVFATLGMFIMTALFNVYVNISVSRSIIYGSLSSIVALLMWFWFMSWVICLGAIFNKGWSEINSSNKQIDNGETTIIDVEPEAMQEDNI